MVIYKREKKRLIIPDGFGVGVGDCSEAIEQSFQSGWTAGYQAGLEACQNNNENQ